MLTGLGGLKQSLDTPIYGIESYRLQQHLFTENTIDREKLVSQQSRPSCSYCELTFCNSPIHPSSADFCISIVTPVVKVCQLKQLDEQASQCDSPEELEILPALRKFFLAEARSTNYQVNGVRRTMSVKTDCLVCDR